MNARKERGEMFATLSPTKLFFHCAVPSMVSMAVTSLYVVADGIFVGRYLGDRALAAVNLVMPLIMISFALADMIAVGSSVQIAIHMGKKQGQTASQIFSFSCGLIFLLSIVIGGLGYGLAGPLVRLLGADEQVTAMAVAYLRVYCVFAPLIMCFFALDNYLRICGRVKYSMWMNVVVSAANILLDYIFLGWFRWGIGAAALASCLCLAAGTLTGFLPFLRGKLPLRLVKAKLSRRMVGNLVANGSSEFFSNIASSVCMVLFNAALMRISGYLAVAAFSIVQYVDSIVKSMLFGMADALQPAISYQVGAGKPARLVALERRVQVAAALLSLTALAGMLWAGRPLIALFSQPGNQALLDLSVRAMQLFALSYLVSWFGVVTSSFLTAVNRPASSLVLSLSQAFLLPVLFLSILPRFWGLDGIWLTSLASCAVAAVLAAVLLRRALRRIPGGAPKSRENPAGLRFEPVTRENQQAVLALRAAPEQAGFVEPVAECLQEAGRVRAWRPVAIYQGQTLVGFAMYGCFWRHLPFQQVWLDRLLIDRQYQGQGYGKAAVRGLVRRLEWEYTTEKVYLSVVERNQAALGLYQRLGFRPTGKRDKKGERILVLSGGSGQIEPGHAGVEP